MIWCSGLTAEGMWIKGSQHGKITLTWPSNIDKDLKLKLVDEAYEKTKDGRFYLESEWTHGLQNPV